MIHPAPTSEATLRVLGLDPSLTCTGWAVLESLPTRPQGIAVAHGYITPPGADQPMHERIAALLAELDNVFAAHLQDQTASRAGLYCAIEIPENKARPAGKRGFASRSIVTLPNLGIPVGACIGFALGRFVPDNVRTVAPSDWLSRDIPRVGGVGDEEQSSGKDAGSDPHKTMRVHYAESVWSLKHGSLGPPSKAGNVADALFIARHALYRIGAARRTP